MWPGDGLHEFTPMPLREDPVRVVREEIPGPSVLQGLSENPSGRSIEEMLVTKCVG